jgi:hypothetical protein
VLVGRSDALLESRLEPSGLFPVRSLRAFGELGSRPLRALRELGHLAEGLLRLRFDRPGRVGAKTLLGLAQPLLDPGREGPLETFLGLAQGRRFLPLQPLDRVPQAPPD